MLVEKHRFYFFTLTNKFSGFLSSGHPQLCTWISWWILNILLEGYLSCLLLRFVNSTQSWFLYRMSNSISKVGKFLINFKSRIGNILGFSNYSLGTVILTVKNIVCSLMLGKSYTVNGCALWRYNVCTTRLPIAEFQIATMKTIAVPDKCQQVMQC